MTSLASVPKLPLPRELSGRSAIQRTIGYSYGRSVTPELHHASDRSRRACRGWCYCCLRGRSQPDRPVGSVDWRNRYRISLCGDGHELCAKLTWLRDDARTDKNLALLNRYVVEHARPGDPNTWIGTMQYDGTTYEATARLVSSDAMELKSCSGVFCRSFTLNRL